jgi:hypothetical protein
MSDAPRRVQEAARDASSTDDLVDEVVWDEYDIPHPLDEETLDERASTQMGQMWEPRRRDAD